MKHFLRFVCLWLLAASFAFAQGLGPREATATEVTTGTSSTTYISPRRLTTFGASYLQLAGGTMTGNITFSTGKGIILPGNGRIDGSAGAVTVTPTSANFILGSGQFVMPLGTAGAPSAAFTGILDKGIYSPTTNQVGVAIGGAGTFFFQNDGKLFGPSPFAYLQMTTAGAINAVAAGTNQSITLTPSGTGSNIFSTATSSIKTLDQSSGFPSLYFATATPSGTNYVLASNGSGIQLNTPSAGAAMVFSLGGSGSVGMRLAATTGNLLLGGLGTDGTGAAQIQSTTLNGVQLALFANYAGTTNIYQLFDALDVGNTTRQTYGQIRVLTSGRGLGTQNGSLILSTANAGAITDALTLGSDQTITAATGKYYSASGVSAFLRTTTSGVGISLGSTNGNVNVEANSVVSTSALGANGTWFSGGTATSTKPHVLIEPNGATSNTWSTAGTGLGVNAANGFTGNLIDAQVNGTSKMILTNAGALTTALSITSGENISAPAGNKFRFLTRTEISAPVDGKLLITDTAGTHGATLVLTTDATVKFRDRADSADAAITAGAGTFSGALAVTGETTIGAGGITADGNGYKHARLTTGSINAASTALVTVTWGTTFADANYTVSAEVVDSTAAALALQVVHVETISASAVAVRVQNTSAGALTGTLHVIAVHD